MPHVTDAPDRHIDPNQIPAENVPFESSPVLVIPQPYNCTTGGSTKTVRWIVRGTVPPAMATCPPPRTCRWARSVASAELPLPTQGSIRCRSRYGSKH